MAKKERKLIHRMTARDFEWSYYKDSGKGGQKRNKTMNGVRCKHAESGAIGTSCDTRSQAQNKRIAFKRMTETEEFKKWLRLDSLKRVGMLDRIEHEVDRSLAPNNIKVETKEDGRWTEEQKDA